MLMIRNEQIEIMTRHCFYEKLDNFVLDYSLRDDWTAWMANTKRVYGIWDKVWPQVRDHNEHDCALCLVLLAISEFEGVTYENSGDFFSEDSCKEIAMKQYIADHGYLYFTAFDYPVKESKGAPSDV